ncbi:MAG: Crp/Fnr family transcriptional regulator [Candidatus Acetothermia bacterium]
MLNEVIELLKDVPLFSHLKKKSLRSVAKTAKKRNFEAGEPILREGEQKRVGFYLILEGQVEVKQGDSTLSKLGSGQFFGEMSALDGKPRSADVITTTDTECLVITNWDIKSLINTDPDVAMGIIEELTRRLRETNMALTK